MLAPQGIYDMRTALARKSPEGDQEYQDSTGLSGKNGANLNLQASLRSVRTSSGVLQKTEPQP